MASWNIWFMTEVNKLHKLRHGNFWFDGSHGKIVHLTLLRDKVTMLPTFWTVPDNTDAELEKAKFPSN